MHTIAGYVSVTSLGVALLSYVRLRFRKNAPAAPVVAPPLAAEALPASFDEDGSTIVVPLDTLLDASETPSPALPANPKKTPRVLLVCRNDVEPDEATSPHARILITASGVSDRGRKRRTNEDSFLLLHDHAVFAVADGMGGYNGGEIASSLAVNTIRETFEQKSFESDLHSNLPLPRRSRELACSLLEANRAVLAASRTRPELAEMGTTLVAARFSPNKQRVYVGNVGDSRCYRFREGELVQLTTDHTMRGLGDVGPTKNQLYRAIGVQPTVDIDVVVDVPHAADVYLLCSDGLPKMASADEIRRVLSEEADLELAAHRLVALANDAGGKDNVTVVLVRVQDRIATVANAADLARSQRQNAHSALRSANNTDQS